MGAAAEALEAVPELPGLVTILATSAALDEVMARRAVAAGAIEFCLKPIKAEVLHLALRFAAAHCVPGRPGVRLTEREERILAWLAEGLAYKEIGERLPAKPALLGKLRKRIYRKLHAHSRTLAVNKWRQGG